MSLPDKFHKMIQKIIDEKKPQSPEELQEILNAMSGKSFDEMKFTPESDEEKALALVWEARELPIDKGRRRAKKALKIYPDCIEAYEYLGSTYQYYHKGAEHYEKGVEIGRRVFGGDFLKQNKGHFWMITETRPFMRCLGALADAYYFPGGVTKAIPIWEEMLDLNPNDNQGIRYSLLSAYLEDKDFVKFKKLRKEFDESGALMLFPDALAEFAQNGDTPKAQKLLQKAKKSNQYVVPLLVQQYPPEEHVYSYSWGSEEEAIIYLNYGWRSWMFNQGAKDWVKKYNYK